MEEAIRVIPKESMRDPCCEKRSFVPQRVPEGAGRCRTRLRQCGKLPAERVFEQVKFAKTPAGTFRHVPAAGIRDNRKPGLPVSGKKLN